MWNIKQLFCKHECRYIQTVSYTDKKGHHTDFKAVCNKCGKEKCLRCIKTEDK